MPKILTQAQVDQYAQPGFCGVVDVLTPRQVGEYRTGLEAWEAGMGHGLDYREKSRSCLLFDGADVIANHSRVLDAVADVIGPAKPSALPVRGEDRFGHFDAETCLLAEMPPEAIASHKFAADRFAAIQNAGFAKA